MKTTRHLPAALLALFIAHLAPAQAPVPAAVAAHQAGQAFLKENKPKEAADAFEQAAQLDPANADYHADYGRALSQRMADANFMQKAMLSSKMKQAFERALALDPNHVGGLIGMARWYAGAPEFVGGSLEKAASFATRVRGVHPFLGELELGLVAERAEDDAGALGHYEAAAQINPRHPGAQNACGRMLVRLGKPTEARARFEAALQLDPAFAPAKQALARLDQPAG